MELSHETAPEDAAAEPNKKRKGRKRVQACSESPGQAAVSQAEDAEDFADEESAVPLPELAEKQQHTVPAEHCGTERMDKYILAKSGWPDVVRMLRCWMVQ